MPGAYDGDRTYRDLLSDEEQDAVRDVYRLSGLTTDEIDERLDRTRPHPANFAVDARLEAPGREHNLEQPVMQNLALRIAHHPDHFQPEPVAERIAEYNAGLAETNEKLAEYFIRTTPLWEDAVDAEEKETILGALFTGFPHYSRPRNEVRLCSQYLPLVHGTAIADTYLSEGSLSRLSDEYCQSGAARSAATMPYGDIPDPLQDHLPRETPDDATAVSGIRPRLRGMKDAMTCDKLETYHIESVIGNELADRYNDRPPTKETVLITVDDTLIASWKTVGEPSLLGLRDVVEDGRHTLRKGWAYLGTYDLSQERVSAERREGWRILDVDEFPVDPLRPAGSHEHAHYDPAWFRERIDERVAQLEDEVLG